MPVPVIAGFAAIGRLWSVIKLVLGNKLVITMLDNWAKGTNNQIDDMVLSLLKKAMGYTEEETATKIATLERGLSEIQAYYDLQQDAGKVEALKGTTVAWAGLEKSDVNDNIA